MQEADHDSLILVVDGEPHLRHATCHALRSAGYQVMEAATGDDALRLVRECAPGLILLKVALPDIDGIRVCRHIKADPAFADSYVVLLSSKRADSDSQAEGPKAGADGYIAQPISNREILAQVQTMLRLRRAEQALRESELHYRALFESTSTSVGLIALDGRVVDANEAMCTMTGYSKAELRQINLADTCENPADRVVLLEQLRKDGFIHDFETQLRRKDGTVYWANLRIRPLIMGNEEMFLTIALDTTQRKQAEETLRDEKDRAQSYLDIAGTIIIVIDADQTVTLVNRKGCEVLGYDEGEIVGQNWFDRFLPEGDRDRIRAGFKQLVAGEIGPMEYCEDLVLTKSGEERLIAWHNTAVKDGEGRVTATLSSGEDITERKRAEEQIQTSLREKEVLLQEVHHRVKNNLQIISSLLDLQSRSVQDPQARRALQDSQARIRSMAFVHNRLYQAQGLARIQMDDYVRSLTSYLVGIYGSQAADVSLTVECEDVWLGVDAAIPCGLIVNELISNALQHAFPLGGETVGGEIRVEVREEEDSRISLTVSDNGIGLPPDLVWRDAPSLGLQLVDMLAEQLKGTLELNSDAGTAFKITFAEKAR